MTLTSKAPLVPPPASTSAVEPGGGSGAAGSVGVLITAFLPTRDDIPNVGGPARPISGRGPAGGPGAWVRSAAPGDVLPLSSRKTTVELFKELLTPGITARLATLDETVPDLDDDEIPLLLAISDDGAESKSRDTRKFLAACSIAQHHGPSSAPTDQARIETLWGHVEHEAPHLIAVRYGGRGGGRER